MKILFHPLRTIQLLLKYCLEYCGVLLTLVHLLCRGGVIVQATPPRFGRRGMHPLIPP